MYICGKKILKSQNHEKLKNKELFKIKMIENIYQKNVVLPFNIAFAKMKC